MTLLHRLSHFEEPELDDLPSDEPEPLQPRDGLPSLWERRTNGPVICTAIAANGQFVIAGTQAGEVLFLDRTGRTLWQTETRTGIYRLAVAAEAQCFVTGTLEPAARQACLWHFGGRRLATLPTGGDSSGVAITPDGGLIVVGSSDRQLHAYNPDGTQVFHREVGAEVLGVAVSAAGDLIVATCADARIRAYDRAGTPRWTFDSGGRPWAVPRIADEADVVLVGTNRNQVHCLGFDGAERWRFDTGGHVNALAITPDASWCAAAGKANTVFLLDAFGSVIYELNTRKHIYGLSLSSDGRYLVAGANDHYVYLVDTQPPRRAWSTRLEERAHVVALSSEGHWVSVGTYGHVLHMLVNPAQPAPYAGSAVPINPLLTRLVLQQVHSDLINATHLGLVRWFAEFEHALRHAQFDLCDALLEDIAHAEGLALSDSERLVIRSLEGVTWLFRGMALHRQGVLDQARACYAQSLLIQQSLNNQDGAGQVIALLSLLPERAEPSDNGSQEHTPALSDVAEQVLSEIEQRPRVLGMAEQVLEQRLLRASPAEQMQIILVARQCGYLSPLVRALSAGQRIVQAAASAALIDLVPGPEPTVLAQMLRSPYGFVRWQALRMLARRAQDRAAGFADQKAALWDAVVLHDHLSIANPLARREAIQLVRLAGDAADTHWLIAQLADPDADVRLAAVEALGAVGDRSAIPALQKVHDAVTFEGRTIAGAAGEAIAALENRDPQPTITRVALCATDPRQQRSVRQGTIFMDSVDTLYALVAIENPRSESTLTAICKSGTAVVHTTEVVLSPDGPEQHLAEVRPAEGTPLQRPRGRGALGHPPLSPRPAPPNRRERGTGPGDPPIAHENNELRAEPERSRRPARVLRNFQDDPGPYDPRSRFEAGREPPWIRGNVHDDGMEIPSFLRRHFQHHEEPRQPETRPLPQNAHQIVIPLPRPDEGWQPTAYTLEIMLEGAEAVRAPFRLVSGVEVRDISPGLLPAPGQSEFGHARSFLESVPYIDCAVEVDGAPVGVVVTGLLYGRSSAVPIAETSVRTHTEGPQTVTLSWKTIGLRPGVYRVEVMAERGNTLTDEIEIVSRYTARQVVLCHTVDDQRGPIGTAWPFHPGDPCLCVVDLGEPPAGLELQARWCRQGDTLLPTMPQSYVTGSSADRYVAFELKRPDGLLLRSGHYSVVVQGPHLDREERCFEVRPASLRQRTLPIYEGLMRTWQHVKPTLEQRHPIQVLKTAGGTLLLALALLILGAAVRFLAGDARIVADPILSLGQIVGRFSGGWLLGVLALSGSYGVLHTRRDQDQASAPERALYAALHPALLALSVLLLWYSVSGVIFGLSLRWPDVLWGLPGDLRWLWPPLAWIGVPLAYTLAEMARQDEDDAPFFVAAACAGRWVALVGLGGWFGAALVGLLLGIAGALLGSVPHALGLPNTLGSVLLGVGGSVGFVAGAAAVVLYYARDSLQELRRDWTRERRARRGADYTLLDFLVEQDVIPVPPAHWSQLMRAAAFSAGLLALFTLAGVLLYKPLLLPTLEWAYAATTQEDLTRVLGAGRWEAALATALLLAWTPIVAAWGWALRSVELPQSARWLLRRMRWILLGLPAVAVLAILIGSRSAPAPNAQAAINLYVVNRIAALLLTAIILAALIRASLRAPHNLRSDLRLELELDDPATAGRIASGVLFVTALALPPVWLWCVWVLIALVSLVGGTLLARKTR